MFCFIELPSKGLGRLPLLYFRLCFLNAKFTSDSQFLHVTGEPDSFTSNIDFFFFLLPRTVKVFVIRFVKHTASPKDTAHILAVYCKSLNY